MRKKKRIDHTIRSAPSNRKRKPPAKKAARKAAKKKVVRASKAPKTRNENTMTESAFWSWIRSGLRQRSRFWKPILAVKNAAKIPYVGENKRRKFSYICSNCKGEFDSKSVNVHHIHECGSLNCGDDLKGFVERLFCEKEDLKLLCGKCHNGEHNK